MTAAAAVGWLRDAAARACDAIGNRGNARTWNTSDIEAVHAVHRHVAALTELVREAVEDGDPVGDWQARARELLGEGVPA